MDDGLVDQQEGAESSESGTTLSAQQFYQHDPLLVLLKDKLCLNDIWIIAGVMVYPVVVAETRRLTALKQRYDLVRDTFPTWPLEINGLSRLVATVVLPVLFPLLLPLIASLLSSVSHTLGLP